MKIEFIDMIQIFIILMFFVGVVICTITSIKKYIEKFTYDFIKRIPNKSLDYSRFLKIEDYISYEKYDIWRYCVHF